jgi:hypothetical protein
MNREGGNVKVFVPFPMVSEMVETHKESKSSCFCLGVCEECFGGMF